MVLVFNLVFAGSEPMSFSDFNSSNYIFSNIRLTKAVTALLCGMCLPVAGQILQVLFRNPLAGPYVLGISSSASFFVAISIMLTGSIGLSNTLLITKFANISAALTGSLFCTILILFIALRVKNNVFLLLIGLMLGQIFGALQSFVEYFSNDKSLKEFIMWGFGSLGNCSYSDLLIFSSFTLVLLATLFFLAKPFQALLIGENYATSLGINFKLYRFYFILISSLLTAIATAFCGPIAFIGLSVPIMSRLIFITSNQKYQLVYCLLLGAIIMLICDTLAHVILPGSLLPVNIITTLIGSPFIIYLLFKSKNW